MQKQHIIITGTSRGLGNVICHQLLDKGYTVSGYARSEVNIQAQFGSSGNNYRHINADLSDIRNIDLLVTEIQEQKTRYLIINAADYTLLDRFNEAELLKQINLNLIFPALLVQKILSVKLQSPLRIIFVSSIMAEIYDGKTPLYGAAKSAISHYINGLQLQGQQSVTFLQVMAGPLYANTLQGSFLKKLSSASLAYASAEIIRYMDSNKSEIFVPGLWRYIIGFGKIIGMKHFSRLMHAYR